MKNQYFGDINDFYKYGLLRLVTDTGLKIGVCWMLTESDDRRDGSKTSYLSQPEIWRHFDPKLYDFLRFWVVERKSRNVTQIEDKRILPSCIFYSEIIRDNTEARYKYIADFEILVRRCDLLFFDADNGMEVKSKPYGRKNSSKYLYWDEVNELYKRGYSLLIFQYHRRMRYADFISCLSAEFKSKTGIPPLYFYRTPRVTLILMAQRKHWPAFKKVNRAIEAHWQEHIRITSGV